MSILWLVSHVKESDYNFSNVANDSEDGYDPAWYAELVKLEEGIFGLKSATN